MECGIKVERVRQEMSFSFQEGDFKDGEALLVLALGDTLRSNEAQ